MQTSLAAEVPSKIDGNPKGSLLQEKILVQYSPSSTFKYSSSVIVASMTMNIHSMKEAVRVSEKRLGILIQCPHSDCKYKWKYRGRFLFYASCPSCRRNLKIGENQITEANTV
jgi:hypothetical protein